MPAYTVRRGSGGLCDAADQFREDVDSQIFSDVTESIMQSVLEQLNTNQEYFLIRVKERCFFIVYLTVCILMEE